MQEMDARTQGTRPAAGASDAIRGVDGSRSRMERAIRWIHANSIPGEGVVVSSVRKVSYPEVTGYTIPTLYRCGERELAHRYARWLVSIQKPDGSMPEPGGDTSYAFDTGQVLRGWVEALADLPELEEPIRKACAWMMDNASAEGRLPVPASDAWSLGRRGSISEGVHLYALPALARAGEILGEPRYARFATASRDYYIRNLPLADFRRPEMLTHLYGYIQEALFDLGAGELAAKGMQELASFQKGNGALPAYFDVNWVCTPGQIQSAMVWYKLGQFERADRALAFIESFLNLNGAFRGSYGVGADYFTDEEISWAVKFYLDAAWMRIQGFFDREHAAFPDRVSPADGRLRAILAQGEDLSGKRVLDVGCGKGRFAAEVARQCPGAEIHGIDISDELLRCVPPGIRATRGSMLRMPYPDGMFDLVYCVEALEHAVRVDQALEEMCRVLAPGGRIVVIDKNAERWGAFTTPEWEQWFTPAGLTEKLGHYCDRPSWEFIGYDRQEAPDGLFVAWKGRRKGGPAEVPAAPQGCGADTRAPLDAREWHESIVGAQSPAAVAERVRMGAVPEWAACLMEASGPGDRVVELGCGTGELSAYLALHGREVVLVDFSPECLDFCRALFAALGLKAEFVQADVREGVPLPDGCADLVWSGGLLEHFDDAEIVRILRESARMSRGRVLSLVPNARSVAYRLGKWMQERSGEWKWGHEDPKAGMAGFFRDAGLTDIRETTVAERHAVRFLTAPEMRPAAEALLSFLDGLAPGERARMDQGYLLATVGSRRMPRRLAVVPSDPLEAYEAAGYGGWLREYYNPAGFFDEVYCLSPVEAERRFAHGMEVVPTPPGEFAKRVEELGIDVVRAYGGFWPSDLACSARVPGVPVVVSVHDASPGNLHDSVRLADHVLSVSGAVRSLLVERGVDPGRITDFTNRVDLRVFRPSKDEGWKAELSRRHPGRYRILHVGRKDESKNIETVIRSLPLLGPEYTCVFIGKGDDEPYRRLARECGALPQCHFVESVRNADLAHYYSFFDCMCTPSRHEGFGIVFIEALACEAVVVTSDIAPMNEYIADGRNGLLVRDFENPAAVADAVRRACTDRELRARLRSKARAAAAPFEKERVDRLEADFYARVLEEARRTGARPQGKARG